MPTSICRWRFGSSTTAEFCLTQPNAQRKLQPKSNIAKKGSVATAASRRAAPASSMLHRGPKSPAPTHTLLQRERSDESSLSALMCLLMGSRQQGRAGTGNASIRATLRACACSLLTVPEASSVALHQATAVRSRRSRRSYSYSVTCRTSQWFKT